MHHQLAALAVALVAQQPGPGGGFRPPAIPLITTGSAPTDDVVRHWDGRVRQMLGLVRVDGVPFRWLGDCVNAPTEGLGPTRRTHPHTHLVWMPTPNPLPLSLPFRWPAGIRLPPPG